MGRLRSLRGWLRSGVGALALLAPLPGLAQEISPALQAEFDTIYQRLLTDPSDRALNRRMIEVALALNDYDAAIGAVERLIFYEPGNPQLQLEAARLYFKIDSHAAARGSRGVVPERGGARWVRRRCRGGGLRRGQYGGHGRG